MDTLLGFIIIAVIIAIIYITMNPEGGAEGLFSKITSWLTLAFDVTLFIVLGIFVVPAMWVMAALLPTWDATLKDASSMKNDIFKIIVLIVYTPLVIISLFIMNLLHPKFEKYVDKWFGKKLF